MTVDLAVLERRLDLVRRHLGWSQERAEGYRAGFLAALGDPDLQDPVDDEAGFDCSRMTPDGRRRLGFQEGLTHGRHATAPSPGEWTTERIGAAVREYEGTSQYAFPSADAEWIHDPRFDLASVVASEADGPASREGWISWLADEHQASLDDGRSGYADLVLQDIRDPILIAFFEGGSHDVWDGWHRTGAIVMKGVSEAPVIRCRAPIPDPRLDGSPAP